MLRNPIEAGKNVSHDLQFASLVNFRVYAYSCRSGLFSQWKYMDVFLCGRKL